MNPYDIESCQREDQSWMMSSCDCRDDGKSLENALYELILHCGIVPPLKDVFRTTSSGIR